MSERRNTKESLVFAVIGIAVAAVFYRASLDLPEPIFEPVGSAFVPQIMAIAAVLCAVAEIAKYLIARRKETLMFNGYESEVASLYEGMDLRKNY